MFNTRDLLSNLFKTAILVFLLLTFTFNFLPFGEQQFSYLAQSFLKGKTYFPEQVGLIDDAIPYKGHYYWAYGPAPAIFLTPFVYFSGLIGKFFYQGYLQFFLVIGVFCLIFKVCQKLRYSLDDSLYLAFAFTFSSAFLGLALLSWSWYFAQVFTDFFLLLGLYELFFGGKRKLVIGLFFSVAVATRINTIFALTLPILSVLLHRQTPLKNKLVNVGKILVFPITAVALVASYNYIRFGDLFNLGHSFGPLGDPVSVSRSQGVYSLVHLPTNLYYLLLSLPTIVPNLPFIKGNPWGMSIFVTSPYLFYLFILRYKDKISKLLLLTVFVIGLTPLFFYSTGYRQFGYRYSMDFFPFLFFLLVKEYKTQRRQLSVLFKILIVATAFSNLYLFTTLFS